MLIHLCLSVYRFINPIRPPLCQTIISVSLYQGCEDTGHSVGVPGRQLQVPRRQHRLAKVARTAELPETRLTASGAHSDDAFPPFYLFQESSAPVALQSPEYDPRRLGQFQFFFYTQTFSISWVFFHCCCCCCCTRIILCQGSIIYIGLV